MSDSQMTTEEACGRVLRCCSKFIVTDEVQGPLLAVANTFIMESVHKVVVGYKVDDDTRRRTLDFLSVVQREACQEDSAVKEWLNVFLQGNA